MQRTARYLTAACAVWLILAMAADGIAQTAVDESVRIRPRPEYEPIGVPLGQAVFGQEGPEDYDTIDGFIDSMTLYPRLLTSVGYSDNVFRDETSTESDTFLVVRPELGVRSDWLNHSLEVLGYVEAIRYSDLTSENVDNWGVEGRGRVDIDVDWLAFASAGHRRYHESRGTPEDPGRDSTPLGVFETFGEIGTSALIDDFLIRPSFRATRLNFDDGNFRDRWVYDLEARLGYEFQPGTLIFVEPSYNWRRYDEERDLDGFLQDSQGWEVRAGVTWNVSPVTFIEASAGVLSQSYDEPRFDDTEGLAYDVRVVWNATDLTTLTVAGGSSIEETTFTDGSDEASGVLSNSLNARVDHELYYNVLLNGELGIQDEQFDGTNRNDTIFVAGAGARYLVNDYVFGEVSYRYRERDSTSNGASYQENRVLFTLGLQR